MAMFESFARQDLNALRFPSADRRPRADAGRRERAKLAFAPGQDDCAAGRRRNARHRRARHLRPAVAGAGPAGPRREPRGRRNHRVTGGCARRRGMLGEMLKIRAGISLLDVPYKGAQGVQDTVAGRTQLTIQGIPAIAAVVQRGQLRALAVSSPRRLPDLPEVPSFSETMPGFEFNGWFAVVAPLGTPREAIQRMNLEFNRWIASRGVPR